MSTRCVHALTDERSREGKKCVAQAPSRAEGISLSTATTKLIIIAPFGSTILPSGEPIGRGEGAVATADLVNCKANKL